MGKESDKGCPEKNRAIQGLAGHGQELALYSKCNQKPLHGLGVGTIII